MIEGGAVRRPIFLYCETKPQVVLSLSQNLRFCQLPLRGSQDIRECSVILRGAIVFRGV